MTKQDYKAKQKTLNNKIDEICLLDAEYYNNPKFINLNNQLKAVELLLNK